MKWMSLLFALSITTAQGASIAVIDSGLDYQHEMIVPNLWTNTNEVEDRRDNDGNGYQDDVHGWNFAEQNGVIIDYKYLGTFSSDCKKFFDVQGKIFLGQATEEEKSWLKEKAKDSEFLKEMGKFGNFIHGTHVAGIAAANSKNEIMGIKLIPTEVKPFFESLKTMRHQKFSFRWKILEKALETLAQEQMKQMTQIALFVKGHKIDVANGSFGTGLNQVKLITDNAFKLIFFRGPNKEESIKAASFFLNALIEGGKGFVGASPDTLFVFAAGNDGSNNDEVAISPANVKTPNAITVAATYQDQFLAPFSNYGKKMVDVAAPGMLIHSSIPGNEYLQVSGTSQAAPFVANVAARIKEANPNLKPAQIKEILMSTVDKKSFLSNFVASGGLVNEERAIFAAEMSRQVSLSEAIAKAKDYVIEKLSRKSYKVLPQVSPIPLSPLFN